MAQWLRALAALPEGPGFESQHPHGRSQPSTSNSSSRGSDTLAQTHTCRQDTNAHKIKVNKSFLKILNLQCY